MRTLAVRTALLASTLVTFLACGAPPDDPAESRSVGTSGAALTGGVADTTYPSVALALGGGCVGTFIAPGFVLTSTECVNNGSGTRYFTTDVGTPAQAQHTIGDAWFDADASYYPGQACSVTGHDFALAHVYPPWLGATAQVALGGDMPQPGATVNVVAYGPSATGATQRQTILATVTSFSAPLLDIAPVLGALGPSDSGGAVFYDGKLVGVSNCPSSQSVSDVAAAASWMGDIVDGYASQVSSCSVNATSCSLATTMSVTCGPATTTLYFYRQNTDGSWALLDQSTSPSPYGTTFSDSTGGTYNYRVCDAGACTPVMQAECTPPVPPPAPPPVRGVHCPKGWSPCDGTCAPANKCF